jgi:hypothetical protein
MRKASIEVGDRVHIRTGGGSAAARKYAGQGGRVEGTELGWDRTRFFFVRIDGNSFQTAFQKRDFRF